MESQSCDSNLCVSCSLLRNRPASVDDDDLPGDVVGGIRRQEHGDPFELAGVADPWNRTGRLDVRFGERLLVFMGASLPAFQVGGGLVLLLMALAMLNAQAGEIRQTRAEAAELHSRAGVVPLAVPLLAGPGAISTTIIAAQQGGIAHNTLLVVCIALVCALLWIMLGLAERIARRLGTTGLNIATRLLGLLLAAISIQTMAGGLRVLFPGLA